MALSIERITLFSSCMKANSEIFVLNGDPDATKNLLVKYSFKTKKGTVENQFNQCNQIIFGNWCLLEISHRNRLI